MGKKEVLLEQLTACTDQNYWFVSIASALNGISASQASRKLTEDSHSIWEIVNHLTFWNDRYLKKFKGIALEDHIVNDETFTVQNNTDSEAEWSKATELVVLVLKDWYQSVLECDESKLEAPIQDETKETWSSAIANINIHNAYHIGQIVQIRKQQKSWNSEFGVK